MATWIAHLRLAENLLNYGFDLNRDFFAVGNIAPDCGIRGEDGNYSPSADITHFRVTSRAANPEIFYQQQVIGQWVDRDHYAFLMGYYAHLVADVEWAIKIYRPKKTTPLWAHALDNDPEFIWEIKKDWYGLDFIYLHEHPQHLFFDTFAGVQSVPDYLDYVPSGYLTMTVQRIREYYSDAEGMQLSLNHTYNYLSQAEMDMYIATTTQRLIDIFTEKRVPLR